MFQIRNLLLILLFTFCLSALQAQTNIADLSKQAALVTEFNVNGLKVLVKRRPNSPTVAAGLFVRGGVRNATAATAGLESLTLNAASEAGKNYPRVALRRELARTGTSIGAGSNYDFSVFSLGTTRADFDRAWGIFTDLTLNPSFNAADVERIKQQTLAGLRERNTNADAYLEELTDQAVYVKHPYFNDPVGTPETVAKFTPDDLRRYHQSLLQTSRLLLVVVGDLDAAALKAKVAAAFGKLPRGNYQDKPLPALTFERPSVEVTTRQLPTNYVQGTFAAPAPSDADIYAMRVATTILRERVFQAVRVERNLSYAPNASLENRAANTAGIYVTAVDANQAVSVMLDEIANLQKDLVDEDTINGIIGQDLTTYYLGQETNAAQAADLASHELTGGGWRRAFETLDQSKKVTAADVRRVARKYMRNIKFVVLGDPTKIDRTVFTRAIGE